VHLVGFIIRIDHVARSPLERQIWSYLKKEARQDHNQVLRQEVKKTSNEDKDHIKPLNMRIPSVS